MQHKLIIMNPNEIINPNAEEIASLEAQLSSINVNDLDPSDNGKLKQDSPAVETKPQPAQEEVVTTTETPAEDPIKAELERVKGQTQGKTPQEKFEYKLKLQLAQAKEMGIDVANLAGIKTPTEAEASTEPEKFVTRKDLDEALRGQSTSKSAMALALEIENEAERELHIHYLENKVNPNLTEEEKFQTAKDMVNAIKLKNQVTLSSVKPQAQTHSTSNSFQPAKTTEIDNNRLTPEELYIFNDASKRGFPITKEEIIRMRK